ncbi:MAG TPA: adenylate/guanylate cyclase domain-containing protein [Casimicrobiaceae bacterium]|nr:adenylate/guanylate cyclase domain-containing protein [Casimicrobiaceae bacterium]
MSSSELQQLERTIQGLESHRALLGDAVTDAALGPLRSRLAALRAGPGVQHQVPVLKHVTILFMDVVGSTSLSQHLDTEETSAVMDGVLSRGTAVVEAHRGKVLQYAGDSILAAFGADRAAEDDAERAVRCGLALLDLGKALRVEVQAAHGHPFFDLRVGIHSGGVLLGGGVDEEGTIHGITVNVAARMEQSAPPGGLRISHETYSQVRGVFDVEPQPPLSVKGVDAPLQTYLVVRARPRAFRVATRGIEGVATRMIGREAELHALQAAFERVMASGAGLERVLVVADAGVGKSRLLYEFNNWADARADRFFIFQARATPQSVTEPYSVLRDLFAWRFQILDSDRMQDAQRKLEDALVPLFAGDQGTHEAEAHAHLLGHLIGLDYGDSPHVRHIRDDARQIRSRGFNAAAQALRRISAQGGLPLVIQLDDLHWADDASLDFIDYLREVDRDVPLLLLTLTRPALFERRPMPDHAVRVDLAPLGPHASRDLADELLKKLPHVPVALRDLLTGGADGNPFYMEELVMMLIDQGAIRIGESWSVDGDKLLSLTVPPTLTGVLQARLDSLTPLERRALQLASVIGVKFWDAALAHVESQAAEQLPSLRRRELVVLEDAQDSVGEYAFRHQILHQVTYDTLLKRDKRSAHARTAQWLAHHAGARAQGLLAAAAEHYEKAGDAANAAEFYARAAHHHAATFANEQALHCTARALALVSPHDSALRWRLLATRERTLELLARRDLQLQDIEAMLALADALPPGAEGDARRAEAAWRRCDIADRMGEWARAEGEARRALQLAEQAGAEHIALRAMQRLAQALAFQGNPAAGLAIAEAGLARATARGSLVAQSRLANAMSLCAAEQGDQAASLRHDLAMLGYCRQAGDRRSEAVALINIGVGYLRFGAHAEARQHLEESLQLNKALGNRVVQGGSLAGLSELSLREGDAAAARLHAQAALDILVAADSRLYQIDALHNLGNAELALGQWTAAQEAFERVEALAREIDLSTKVPNALEGQARVALARGDVAMARRAVRELLEYVGDADFESSAKALVGTEEHRIRLTLHEVWRRAEDPRAGIALFDAHRALMHEADAITDAALRRSFLTLIPENREIVELWEASAKVHPSMGALHAE